MSSQNLLISPSEELQTSLQNMKSFIESNQHSDWTVYNSSKKQFLELFKTLNNGPDKQKIWKEFANLTDSAKALRKIQEEEGEFAAEMIAKALDALELELKEPKISFFKYSALEKVEVFKDLKKEMTYNLQFIKFLNSKASQVQSLREELAKTGMRLSIKGRLFDRLSSLGDMIFPVKKELALNLNQAFFEGLKKLVASSEKQVDGLEILFQIKLIQSLLKELSLKKSEYDQVKSILDPLWKKAVVLKDKQEQLQKEAAIKNEEVKKEFEASFESMKQLAGEGKDQEALALYDALLLKLKDRSIQKNDFRALKNSLEMATSPVFQRLEQQKEQKMALQKQQVAVNEEKKSLVKAVLYSEASSQEKRQAFDEARKLVLSEDDLYSFELCCLRSEASEADAAGLEAVYFELKRLQETVRVSLAGSSKDFSLSMNLQEIFEDVKQLLAEIIQKI